MLLSKADGTKWSIEEGNAKLVLRAKLPGARVFDLVADSLRKVRAAGIPTLDRLALALPASWCVNSPAPSTVLRRWALTPQREVWELLVDVLEDPRSGPLDPESSEAIVSGIRVLGPEEFGVEAISKVLALLVPDAVPLMPSPARAFMLGEEAPKDAGSFVAMVDWFSAAAREGGAELASLAKAHAKSAPQRRAGARPPPLVRLGGPPQFPEPRCS